MILDESLFESNNPLDSYTVIAYELNNDTNRMNKTKIATRSSYDAAMELAKTAAERISDVQGHNYVQIVDTDGDEIETIRGPYNSDVNPNIDDLKESTISEEVTEDEVRAEIKKVGTKEQWLASLRRSIAEMKDTLEYLRTQAPREINRGGAYDSYAEIAEAVEEIEFALDEIAEKEAVAANMDVA